MVQGYKVSPMKETVVKELIGQGREAMSLFLESDQARVDEVVTAIAWSIYPVSYTHLTLPTICSV